MGKLCNLFVLHSQIEQLCHIILVACKIKHLCSFNRGSICNAWVRTSEGSGIGAVRQYDTQNQHYSCAEDGHPRRKTVESAEPVEPFSTVNHQQPNGN